MSGSPLYVAYDRIPYDTKEHWIIHSEEASKNPLPDRWWRTRVGCMVSYEKIDEAFIKEPDRKWSTRLKRITPMISIAVILLLAILFSLAWRDQPVPGAGTGSTEVTRLNHERRSAKGPVAPSKGL